QVIPRIKVHRNPVETSAAQELRELLGCRRGWSFWIDVEHLSRAIDDHSELRHLMRAEQAIQMWPGVHIEFALVGDPHWNVFKCAITHSQCRHFADAIMVGVAHDANDVGLSLCNAKSDLLCARAIDQCERAAGID